MAMDRPTAKADSRNSRGRTGVCHRGWSLLGAMAIRVPSDDWWAQDSTTPGDDEEGHHLAQGAVQDPQQALEEPVQSAQERRAGSPGP